jgi:hypothetical protein
MPHMIEILDKWLLTWFKSMKNKNQWTSFTGFLYFHNSNMRCKLIMFYSIICQHSYHGCIIHTED